MSFCILYITHPDEKTAQDISRQLLEKRLIACANIFPIDSMYRWSGEIQVEKEWVSVLKTIPENLKVLQTAIENLHPYTIPCIIHWQATANEAYENWIRQETSAAD